MSSEIKDSSPCRDPQTGALPDILSKCPAPVALEVTALVKGFRQCLDSTLQSLKSTKAQITTRTAPCEFEDLSEVIAQFTLAQRDLESSIMRLGMVLKNIGATPNLYPQPYTPASPVIEKTADGIKL